MTNTMNSFYTENELKELGLGKIGDGVLISRKASIYGAEDIEIGSYVRIDDFCILSGKIKLGSYIHISAYTSLFGGKKEGIIMEDYTTVSSRCAIYALTDDYSGEYMTNSTIPIQYKNVTEAQVNIKTFSIIGSGCTVLPGVVINEGVAVGAMSLVNKSLEEWGIYVGIPCKKIKDRERGMLEQVAKFEKENGYK